MSNPAPLLGLAIGDSAGIPFNGHIPTSEDLRRWDGIVPPNVGDISSITRMTMSLARNLMSDYTYNPATVTSEYVDLYKETGLYDLEDTVRFALDRILWGFHWNASGIAHVNGSAPALRAAPIGIYFRSDLVTVMDMARFDARITHKSANSEEGAIAVALAVALLVEGTSKKDLIKTLVNLMEPSVIRDVLEAVEKGSTPQVPMDLSSNVVIPAAFACFLRTPSFEDAVEQAVRLGGCCSVTAALTGALAGAHYGVKPEIVDALNSGVEIKHVEHILHVSAPKIEDVGTV